MIARDGTGNREHWQAQAARVARRVNFAWWLETLSGPLLVLSILGAIALLVTRREVPGVSLWILLAAVATGLLLLAAGCLAAAVGKFENPDDSLVRIEASMRLRNALSAARAGIVPWPAPIGKLDAGLTWQWSRLLVPLLGAMILLAAGLAIPISGHDRSITTPPEEPQAWKQLSTELDRLSHEEVVDEKYIEETEKQLDELKSQEQEQWFSHSSLEATDNLRKSHRAETARMSRQLESADKALTSLKSAGEAMNTTEKNRQLAEFDQALQGLQNGAMKLNPELLKQLQQLDPKDLSKYSSEQMQQLRDAMQKRADALQDGQPGEGDGEDGEGNGGGTGEGSEGEDGDSPGQGGVDRGPGHDPNVLGKEKDGVRTGDLTGLAAKDLSQTKPGDLLELQDGEHDVDKTRSGITSGGSTEATGQGGDRVWRDALDPAEQQTLKRFFK